jgi:AcrR family transcriptional regulator
MYPKRDAIQNVATMKVEAMSTGGDLRSVVEYDARLPQSRKASQAKTRARLIEVAHGQFLRYGLVGATAEKIAVEAGFTRGALYANFSGIEDLFVAVMRAGVDRDHLMFQSIVESDGNAAQRFGLLREAFGRMMTESPWIVLQAEFQANALRDDGIRAAYLDQQALRGRRGAELIGDFAVELGLRLAGTPEEVVAVLGGMIEGLAVRHVIVGEPDVARMQQLALACFDSLIELPEAPCYCSTS